MTGETCLVRLKEKEEERGTPDDRGCLEMSLYLTTFESLSKCVFLRTMCGFLVYFSVSLSAPIITSLVIGSVLWEKFRSRN